MGCRVGGTVSLKRRRSMLGRVLVRGLKSVVYSMVCSTSPVSSHRLGNVTAHEESHGL